LPILGEKGVKGTIGKIIDIFAVIVSVAGVATSLGMGCLQICGGLNYLFDIPNNANIWLLIIVIICCIYLLSATSGLDRGIKVLSNFNLCLAVILLVLSFCVGPTVKILEIFTTGFLIFWLGIAGLMSMVVSFFTANIYIQTVVFVVASTILMIFTRPILNKFFKIKDSTLTPTNVYSIIGKKGIVVENINNIDYTGKVKVSGELWSAISSKDLEKGTYITVTEVDGVKLKVEPIKEKEEFLC
jgi:membrane protein implicated in regulation of membrane protease activity